MSNTYPIFNFRPIKTDKKYSEDFVKVGFKFGGSYEESIINNIILS